MVDSNVKLIKNDGSESFTLPADNVTPSGERSVVATSGKGAVKDFVGDIPELEGRTYEVSGTIQNIDPGDYPNSADYNDDNAGFQNELQLVLSRWFPDTANGYDTLEWDKGVYTGGGRGGENPRVVSGTVTSVVTPQDQTSDAPRIYDFSLEFTQVDVYNNA